jgi:hypothetical protein
VFARAPGHALSPTGRRLLPSANGTEAPSICPTGWRLLHLPTEGRFPRTTPAICQSFVVSWTSPQSVPTEKYFSRACKFFLVVSARIILTPRTSLADRRSFVVSWASLLSLQKSTFSELVKTVPTLGLV